MATAVQRPLKGSRISTFYPIKSVPALSTLDSAFQLQEFISLTIRSDIHDVSAIISVPDSRNSVEGGPDDSSAALTEDTEGDKDTKSEFAVDEACWIYEQLRRLAQDLSHPLITMLQQECTRATCPEMKAGEWMYLCVAHGNDGAMEQCCAIDYILHTVDSATALLNSPRAFPSRINIPPPSHRHFGSLARRLGRIFAHAYFHHREVFEQAEAESSLYARFLALTCKFELVPPEFLIIPTHSTTFEDAEPPRLLAAAVDPQHSLGPEDEGDDRGRGVHRGLGVDILGGIDRNPSPRKGRTRTGTMVFSEALIMAEELGKGGGSPSPERDSIVHLAAAATEAHEQETDFVHVDVAGPAEEEEPLTD
ncbi:Mob1/phocein, partial [Lactarius psammicola]